MASWRGEDRGGSLVGQVGEGGGCLHGEVEGEGDGGDSISTYCTHYGVQHFRSNC